MVDFNQMIQRKGTQSVKWELNQKLFGREELLAMWVADMDFPAPIAVQKAIEARATHPIYGYTFAPDSFYEAIINWVERRYHWKIEREWIVVMNSVVEGLYASVRAYCAPGDRVLIQPPVYPPFMNAVTQQGYEVVENPLLLVGDQYEMDWEQLEQVLAEGGHGVDRQQVGSTTGATGKNKLLFLCSPHNPGGRVWTKAELTRLAELCQRYQLIIVSDEVHADLLYEPAVHTATATLAPEVAAQSVTFFAPSKTFNVAGLQTAYAIIPNPQLRESFIAARRGLPAGNLFGYAALEAAYNEGETYLNQLLQYLQGNRDYLYTELRKRFPQLRPLLPQATFLMWVDMSALGLSDGELRHWLIHEAGLGLNDGPSFGTGGAGFQRINFGTPRPYLEEALRRLEKAVASLPVGKAHE